MAIMFLHLHIHDRVSQCVVTQNTYLLILYIKKHKNKIYNTKIKSGFGILYLCLHKPILEVGACLDHGRSQSSHRDSHLW